MQRVRTINPGDVFSIEKTIGKGSYGVVYKATRRADQKAVAVKVIGVSNSASSQKALDNEIEALELCKSRYIVGFEGAYLEADEQSLWIAMEYCVCSCLDVMNYSNRPFDEVQIAAVCNSALRGLAYLHDECRFIHRDVKASNLLLTSSGQCKLCDLGIAADLGPSGKRGTVIGTPLWMSPELIQDGAYNEKTDIWSLGITAIELAEMHPPHWQINPPVRALFLIPSAPAPRLSEGGNWTEGFSDFIISCLQKDPEERASAKELLDHRFVAQLDDKAIASGAILQPLTRGAENTGSPAAADEGHGKGNPRQGDDQEGQQGTLATLVLTHDLAIKLPPVTRRKAPAQDGTLVADEVPQPFAGRAVAGEEAQRTLPAGAVDHGTLATDGTLKMEDTALLQEALQTAKLPASFASQSRGDFGCGTLAGSEAPVNGSGAGGVVALNMRGGAEASAPAPEAPSEKRERDVAGSSSGGILEGILPWFSGVVDSTRAAVEAGVLSHPEVPMNILAGNAVGALTAALRDAPDAATQARILQELHRRATGGHVDALVAEGAHEVAMSTAFAGFDFEHLAVREHAIKLLHVLLESPQAAEWLSTAGPFASLCYLVRSQYQLEDSVMHTVLCLDLIRSLLARKPASKDVASQMQDAARDLVSELRTASSTAPLADQIDSLLNEVDSLLPSESPSESSLFGRFFQGRSR